MVLLPKDLAQSNTNTGTHHQPHTQKPSYSSTEHQPPAPPIPTTEGDNNDQPRWAPSAPPMTVAFDPNLTGNQFMGPNLQGVPTFQPDVDEELPGLPSSGPGHQLATQSTQRIKNTPGLGGRPKLQHFDDGNE